MDTIKTTAETPLGETTIEAGKTFEKVPPGIYECEFRGASEKTITRDGESKPTTEWRFEITRMLSGGDGKDRTGQTIDGLADKPATVGNKLGRWLNGLTGKPTPVAGQAVKPTDYIGKRYMAVVTTNKAGKPALDTFSPLAS